MLELEDLTYSRHETISAVTDYCQFLTQMYLLDSQVIYPPAGGWPSIVNADAATLAALGKSDEVLALLAHLPYIRNSSNWSDDAEAMPGCVFADWQDLIVAMTRATDTPAKAKEIRVITEDADFFAFAPSHTVSLTCGGRENPVLILDTKYGIIHWEECPLNFEHAYFSTRVDYDPPDGDSDSDSGSDEDQDHDQDQDQDDERDESVRGKELAWRQGAPAWAIPNFFENLKDRFKKLHWFPTGNHSVRNSEWVDLDGEGMVTMVQDIYREHSWPDLTQYRKDECLDAVRTELKARYPSCIDFREC